MWNYNTINPLDLISDNHKEDISPTGSNNGKKEIRPADINNNKKDIQPVNIDKQRLAIPNWTAQNRLLSELSSNLKNVTFSES